MTGDSNSEIRIALELARWASERIAARRPVNVTSKSDVADLVTETDLEVERHVRDVIADRFPGHAVVGEEYGGDASDDGPTWYLDPVDGTTNYAHGVPWCSFSLALVDADGPAVAVVADPHRGEIFSAERGLPALCNGIPIRCRDTATLAGAIVTTEWQGHVPWEGMDVFLRRLAGAHCTTRIMGSTALAVSSVAAGRAAGSVIGWYHAIDALAAAFIAQQAGAVSLDEAGKRTVFPEQGGILVAAPNVADVLWNAWRR